MKVRCPAPTESPRNGKEFTGQLSVVLVVGVATICYSGELKHEASVDWRVQSVRRE